MCVCVCVCVCVCIVVVLYFYLPNISNVTFHFNKITGSHFHLAKSKTAEMRPNKWKISFNKMYHFMRMFSLFVVLARTCRSRNNYSKTNNSFMIVDFHTYPLALWTSSSRKGWISAGLASHLNLSPHTLQDSHNGVYYIMAHITTNGLINL